MQPFFCIVLCFFMWPCVLCIVIHSSRVELWSSHITCTYHLLSFLHVFHLGMSIFLSFVGMFFLLILCFFLIAWTFLIFYFSIASCFDCSLSFYQVFAIVWNSPWILKNCWSHWEWLSSSLTHCNMFGKKTIHLQQFFFQHLTMKGKSWYSLWLLFCIIYD